MFCVMKNIPFGKFHPTDPVINAVIEVPAGSQQKFSFNEEIQATVLSRVLAGGLRFPFNYGYIPQTITGDNSHLDVFVISTHPIASHLVVPSRPVGLIEITDRGRRDNKIVAVPLGDREFAKIETWEDLPEAARQKLADFYEHYPKQLDHDLRVSGYHGKKRAVEELRLAQILE